MTGQEWSSKKASKYSLFLNFTQYIELKCFALLFNY